MGRAETAISELIKNAYDAEASYAHLIFKNAYVPGGSLVIEDNLVRLKERNAGF